MNQNEQQLARVYARARDAEQAHARALNTAKGHRDERDRLVYALRDCLAHAERHLRGESGLEFASAGPCLRGVAETAREALEPKETR